MKINKIYVATAGLPISYIHTQKIASKPEGLRRFRDHHWKSLGKENSDLPRIFLCKPLFASFQNNFENSAQTKMCRADLDSPRRMP